ncbi:sigma-70 family RNA polymerase sigma factor [Clostridium estertheticum]|uniref:sigma-70 family RNA polymerase sigma factor n=1 Tax=Clostridium estertheticum TaxID=238834 RepID=UPI001C0E7C06|nr:sigma-70 family RNA polymerase sigma factor [Clostridium estertheticum]MBU3073216.1 sigma-70 family RNA polymerase sigma factor [Clostridium estertheticum]MBU3163543.1 sigma-70 family RNA polymerase sigma factor [Clostridium estertheticum]
MEKLVEKSKNGDNKATELIIGKFKYLVFKESSKYHIPGYTNEDLIQHGYLSVIKAIALYKLGSNSFNGYCINAIKMNFKALLKGEIKHFREVPNSNMVDFDAQEHYEFTLEDEVIAYDEVEKLYVALNTLEPFERYILERFYIMGQSLTEIACTTDKSYYKYSRIKKKALEKLKAIM